MTRRIPISDRGRDFVLLHTRIRTDWDFRALSNAARLLFVLGLAEAGCRDEQGTLPSDPRILARMFDLKGGAEEAEAAVGELVDGGLLVEAGDLLCYPTWDRYQARWETPAEQSDQRRSAVHVRWHNDGKHDRKPHPDCPKCPLADIPDVAVEDLVEPTEELAVVPETAASEAPPQAQLIEVPGEMQLTVADARARMRELTVEAVDAAEEDLHVAVEHLSALYGHLERAPLGRFGGVKGVTTTVLLNAVVHCFAELVWARGNAGLAKGELSKLAGLRKTHGRAVFSAIAASADADKPIAYMVTVLASSGSAVAT